MGKYDMGKKPQCNCSSKMTITTSDNDILKCDVVNIFDIEDKSYIALLPQNEEDVLLYRYIREDNVNFKLENIETDEEFEAAKKEFFEIIKENDEYEYEEED